MLKISNKKISDKNEKKDKPRIEIENNEILI